MRKHYTEKELKENVSYIEILEDNKVKAVLKNKNGELILKKSKFNLENFKVEDENKDDYNLSFFVLDLEQVGREEFYPEYVGRNDWEEAYHRSGIFANSPYWLKFYPMDAEYTKETIELSQV